MGNTSIEWTDATWNPVRGCSRVSAGCGDAAGGGCYAERQAYRFSGVGQAYEGLVRMTSRGPRWTGETRLWEPELTAPLKLRKPSRVFVADMGDLFYEGVSDEDIDKVFAVMALCPQHTFQVLTKRAERMRKYFEDQDELRMRWAAAAGCLLDGDWIWNEGKRFRPQIEKLISTSLGVDTDDAGDEVEVSPLHLPLANCHLGVSVEDQQTADKRIPHLLKTPAGVRWVSYEPALGPVDFSQWLTRSLEVPMPAWSGDGVEARGPRIDWIVCGGELGPGARPMHPAWARSARDQCVAAGVKFFFKQWGEYRPAASLSEATNYPFLVAGPDSKSTTMSGCYYLDHQVEAYLDGQPLSMAQCALVKVGKKNAGQLLDGREWNELPA